MLKDNHMSKPYFCGWSFSLFLLYNLAARYLLYCFANREALMILCNLMSIKFIKFTKELSFAFLSISSGGKYNPFLFL